MCHCYPHFTEEVTDIQGHSVIKGALKFQTQAVWFPEIPNGEQKEGITETFTQKPNK